MVQTGDATDQTGHLRSEAGWYRVFALIERKTWQLDAFKRPRAFELAWCALFQPLCRHTRMGVEQPLVWLWVQEIAVLRRSATSRDVSRGHSTGRFQLFTLDRRWQENGKYKRWWTTHVGVWQADNVQSWASRPLLNKVWAEVLRQCCRVEAVYFGASCGVLWVLHRQSVPCERQDDFTICFWDVYNIAPYALCSSFLQDALSVSRACSKPVCLTPAYLYRNIGTKKNILLTSIRSLQRFPQNKLLKFPVRR